MSKTFFEELDISDANTNLNMGSGNHAERIRKEYHETLKLGRKPQMPELWDGKTAEKYLHAIFGFPFSNNL